MKKNLFTQAKPKVTKTQSNPVKAPNLPKYQSLKRQLAKVGPEEQKKLLETLGPGKREVVIFTQPKPATVSVDSIIIQPDGVYVCTEVRNGASCSKRCSIYAKPWNPKKMKGKKLTQKTFK